MEECVCKIKGAGGGICFFEQGEYFPKALSKLSQLPSWLGLGPVLPQDEGKGRQIAMAGLHQSEFMLWAWHAASSHPKLGSVGKEEGELSSQWRLLMPLWSLE